MPKAKDESHEETKLRELWKLREPFLMQMEVIAPYDGCYCEPNLFLVAPKGLKSTPKKIDAKTKVFPLYASGQGVAMDSVHSLAELLSVCEQSEIRQLSAKSVLQPSSYTYGKISLIDVAPLGPINTALPVGERYWMHALHVAEEQWGVQLKWKCEKCDKTYEYDSYEGRPEATGYHGDGGIGIHLTGVMCDSCLQDGACMHCRDNSGDPMEYYDLDIVENGWHLCAYCTEGLLSTCGISGDVDLPKTIELKLWKDPAQLFLPGIEAEARLAFFAGDKRFTDEEISFDSSALQSMAGDMHIEALHPIYGHEYGISLSGTAVENVMFRNRKEG